MQQFIGICRQMADVASTGRTAENQVHRAYSCCHPFRGSGRRRGLPCVTVPITRLDMDRGAQELDNDPLDDQGRVTRRDPGLPCETPKPACHQFLYRR